MARKSTTSFQLSSFLDHVGEGRTILHYEKNQVIYSQAEPADAIYYVQKGKIKLTVVSRQGKEAVIGLIGVGDFFGEGCLGGQPLRLASASAMTRCSVTRVDKATTIRVLAQQPAFAELFLAYMVRRTIRIEEDLVDQLFNSTEKRLARVLLLLTHFGKDGKHEPIPKISQETLAGIVGTTRPRVNRFMNKFRKLGFIDYNDGLEVHSSLLNMVLHD